LSARDLPLPYWFASKKFAYPAAADARGWYGELLRINGFFWKEREEWRDTIPEIDEFVPGFIGPPPVEAIDRDEAARELYNLEKPALLVRVWLRAPDAVILKEFRAALREARKTHPAPVKNRGRDGLAGRFSKSKLGTWQRYHIIELAELLAWRDGLLSWQNSEAPSPRPSDAQLGRWLGFDAAEVRVAKRTLESARAMIPVLWAQVEGASVK
jgi:hypothetical protein